MELFSDATTPFGRKVLIAALERGIPLTETFVTLAEPGAFLDVAPIGQIPALTTDKGQSLYDSDVILDFLDTCHDGPAMVSVENRHADLTRIHLANGLIEAVLLRIMEIKRPDGEKSPSFIAHLEKRADRVITHLETQADLLSADLGDGPSIAAACALEYADFRYREDWRKSAPKLATWLAGVADRPSMVASRPTRTAPVNSPLT